jgi:hypothetical protein
MLYTFEFSSIYISNTRSVHNDTDYATFGLTVLDAAGAQVATYGPNTKGLGDLNNGDHAVGLIYQDIDVPDGGSVAVVATVINKGSWSGSQPIETALNTVGGAVIGALISGSIVGFGATAAAVPVAGWVAIAGTAGILGVLEAVNLLWADCDGWVVTGSFTLTRAALDEQTAGGPWHWGQDYPGSDSAAGCGSNSQYRANFLIGRPGQQLHLPLGITITIP